MRGSRPHAECEFSSGNDFRMRKPCAVQWFAVELGALYKLCRRACIGRSNRKGLSVSEVNRHAAEDGAADEVDRLAARG
jgi:hypothetical protein